MPPIVNEYSNKTIYGIENDALRYTWAGYYLFVILSSLIGDTTILVASIKYKAIKLHRVIVTIIQHIAVCDLLVVTVDVFPTFITVIADRWVLGEYICYAVSFAPHHVFIASILLICATTTCKLLLLKYPLRFGTTSSKKVHLLCAICWVIALTLPITTLLVDWKDVGFSYIYYMCMHGFSSDIWRYLLHLKNFILLFLPATLVVITSVNLLVIAKRYLAFLCCHGL